MFSLEPEIAQSRDRGLLDDAAASRLIAAERREVVNVWPELRFLTWAGVMLIAAGVSVLVARHLQDLGPVIIATGIAIAAAACYAWTEWKRTRDASLVDDFVLLLGSLLLSADAGYIESQWHVFGNAWPRHLLILAIVHAFVAYRYGSRLVLSLSLSALAGYLGIERRAEALFEETTDMAVRGYVAAALIIGWRQVDRMRRGVNPFTTVFEHFAANLSFYASVVLMLRDETRIGGCLIALVLAAFCAWYGLRTRQEMFVIYAWIVAAIAIDVLIAEMLDERVLIAFSVIVSSIALIVALFVTHARFKEVRT